MQHTYNHSGQMSTSIALTYDELLTEHVGQFGPGQLLSLFWASLHEIANAAALFIWVFLTVDAVANHNWRCTDPSDAVCMEVWRQDSPDSASFCQLRSEQWLWISQREEVLAKVHAQTHRVWLWHSPSTCLAGVLVQMNMTHVLLWCVCRLAGGKVQPGL